MGSGERHVEAACVERTLRRARTHLQVIVPHRRLHALRVHHLQVARRRRAVPALPRGVVPRAALVVDQT